MIAAWPCPVSGEEYAVCFDRKRDARLLVIPALFDESNKLRRLTVDVMRRLDSTGIDSFMPDLPGWNESLAPLEEQTLEGWRHAAGAAARHFVATHVLTFRGGAIIAPPDLPGWRYAPVAGSSILRALLRARVVASREMGVDETRDGLLETGCIDGLELAGYRLGSTMVRALSESNLAENEGKAEVAQGDIGGGGLWLRAEPRESPEQAARLAEIVAAGIAR